MAGSGDGSAGAHGWRAFARAAVTAWLAAITLDLALSLGAGYVLRTGFGLAVASALYLLPAVALTLGVLWLPLPAPLRTPLGLRAPVATGLLAAGLPIAVAHLTAPGARGGTGDAPALLIAGAAWVTCAVVLALSESRRAPLTARARDAVLSAVAVAAVAFAAASAPAAGRAQLAAPREEPATPATRDAPNLLMIVLDTMRADHLEIYGYGRPTSPWLARYARQATVYERAYSSSSFTLPAHATLFTGRFTREHGAHAVDAAHGLTLADVGRDTDQAPVAALPQSAETLAELLRGAGLETGAVCANTAYLYRAFGLDQGFDTYVDAPPLARRWRPAGLGLGMRVWPIQRVRRMLTSNERYYHLAPEVNKLALEWLDARSDRRFFLFLNYMDPHGPRVPLGPNRQKFAGSGRPRIDAYDAETRYLDDHLAALFEALEERGLLQDTLVVLVGDHGESFSEHGNVGHGLSLYEPELRVPLVVKMPGQTQGKRVGRFVHLVDVLPTVLDRMAVAPPAGLRGQPLTTAKRTAPLVAYLGQHGRSFEEVATYREPWKLIVRSQPGPGAGEARRTTELYNVVADPLEREDLSARMPARVQELAQELAAFERGLPERTDAPTPAPDARTRERLEALGYGR
jgi:arylsulfatase A-like enzyme